MRIIPTAAECQDVTNFCTDIMDPDAFSRQRSTKREVTNDKQRMQSYFQSQDVTNCKSNETLENQ
jgi:hypothetical protein